MPALSCTVAAMTLAALSHAAPPAEKTFGEDARFLSSSKETIVLSSKDGSAKIAVVPGYQGRVMTSTAGGDAGQSYGFLNYDLISSGKLVPHINAFGGEDRFWLGPEGGQFAIFFEKSKGDGKFTLDFWQTPPAIDADAYAVASKTDSSVTFQHTASFTNYSGHKLDVKIDRTVRLLDAAAAAKALKFDLGKSKAVAFESENTITNIGKSAWTKDTGMLSVWILGMFKPGPHATVVLPFQKGTESDRGPFVNDAYFGKVPSDRLNVDDKAGAMFFKADGQKRSKIGISPRRAVSTAGSYDPDRSLLTLVTFTLPDDAAAKPYVNSMWEIQKDPFAGDTVNSYNDGPSTPGGKPFGPFYELETSSPAAALAPGATLTHTHRTIHIEGPKEDLDRIAKSTLGVGLDQITAALTSK